jgi:hypothetical protein
VAGGIGDPGPVEPDRHGIDQDLALARLEDVLQSLPFERALPDLHVILERAGMPEELLRRDERVLKVLHEAILARPLATLDDVTRARTEVELLTLEVELLTDRLADPDADEQAVAQTASRLDEVRLHLERIRDQL